MNNKHTWHHIILGSTALALSLSFYACTDQSPDEQSVMREEQQPGTAASPSMEEQQPGTAASPSMDQQPGTAASPSMDQQPGEAGNSVNDSDQEGTTAESGAGS